MAILVRQSDAPDISASGLDRVETPEHQPVFDGAQLREPLFVQRRESVAFGAVLVSARRRSGPDGDQLAFGSVAQFIEPVVQAVDVVLLAFEFGLRFAHRTPSEHAPAQIMRRLPYRWPAIGAQRGTYARLMPHRHITATAA